MLKTNYTVGTWPVTIATACWVDSPTLFHVTCAWTRWKKGRPNR